MTRNAFRSDSRLWRAPLIAGIGSALLFAACATTSPEPTLAIRSAEQAIAAADQARVADAASPDLNEAREKLTAAQRAVKNDDMVEGERLARESRAAAELASAKIEAAKERAVNDDIKRSTVTLAQEMQRNSTSGVK